MATLGRASGLNWFDYCCNDPLNNVDKDGCDNTNVSGWLGFFVMLFGFSMLLAGIFAYYNNLTAVVACLVVASYSSTALIGGSASYSSTEKFIMSTPSLAGLLLQTAAMLGMTSKRPETALIGTLAAIQIAVDIEALAQLDSGAY